MTGDEPGRVLTGVLECVKCAWCRDEAAQRKTRGARRFPALTESEATAAHGCSLAQRSGCTSVDPPCFWEWNPGRDPEVVYGCGRSCQFRRRNTQVFTGTIGSKKLLGCLSNRSSVRNSESLPSLRRPIADSSILFVNGCLHGRSGRSSTPRGYAVDDSVVRGIRRVQPTSIFGRRGQEQ